MFKKPKRNYRANRRRDCDNEDGKEKDTVETYDVDADEYFTVKVDAKPTYNKIMDPIETIDLTESKPKKKKVKKTETSKKTILSFEDDGMCQSCVYSVLNYSIVNL